MKYLKQFECDLDLETPPGSDFREKLRSIFEEYNEAPLQDFEVVRRTCNNPRCIKPEHLTIYKPNPRVLKPLSLLQAMIEDYLYTFGAGNFASKEWLDYYRNHFQAGQSTIEYTVHKHTGRHINNLHVSGEFGY